MKRIISACAALLLAVSLTGCCCMSPCDPCQGTFCGPPGCGGGCGYGGGYGGGYGACCDPCGGYGYGGGYGWGGGCGGGCNYGCGYGCNPCCPTLCEVLFGWVHWIIPPCWNGGCGYGYGCWDNCGPCGGGCGCGGGCCDPCGGYGYGGGYGGGGCCPSGGYGGGGYNMNMQGPQVPAGIEPTPAPADTSMYQPLPPMNAFAAQPPTYPNRPMYAGGSQAWLPARL